ncbi:hypothetical protein JOD97_006371 [Duganella sp. 1411]|jgi:hypothetical protein|nr:hypothetical protein [Duganella sp. 1411]
MPVQKIPTVSRRFHPALSAAVAVLGVAATIVAVLIARN